MPQSNTTKARTHRYYLRLSDEENLKIIEMMEQCKMTNKSLFMRHRLLDTPIKIISVDKTSLDIYAKISEINAQIRRIGILYNQVTKAINRFHTIKTAQVLLNKLVGYTEELRFLEEQVQQLSLELKRRWLQR